MTKSVFNFIYTTTQKVLMYLMLAIFSFLILRNVFALANLFGFASANLVLDIVGLSLCVFIVAFIVLLLTFSHYSITNYCLYVRMGMIFQKIPCGLISSVVKIAKDDTVFILYTSFSGKPCQQHVNIKISDIDAFVDALRANNSHISYQIVQPEELV